MELSLVEQLQPLSYYMRNKSNEDCLLKIFSYLNSVDLMQICDLDTENDRFFNNLIKHHIISKKLVCASSWRDGNSWRIKKTLETFGGMIRRLKVQTPLNHFNNIIRGIMTNCSIDTLVELQIEIRSGSDVDGGNRLDISQDLLTEAIPYFRSLEVLRVHDRVKVNDLERFVALVMNNAVNLRSLSLNGVILYNLRELLSAPNYNFTELDLLHVDLLKKEPVRRQPPRRHRQYDDYYGNDEYYNRYFNNCDDDHDYENRRYNNYCDRYGYEDDDEDYYDEYQEMMEKSHFQSQILNIFLNFSHLELFVCNEDLYSVCLEIQTELKKCCPEIVMVSAAYSHFCYNNFSTDINDVTSVTVKTIDRFGLDLKDKLVMLATKNKIHKLTIQIDLKRIEMTDLEDENAIEQPFDYPNGFASLHTLTLSGLYSRSKTNSNMGLFTRNVIRPMRGLETITFSSLRYIEKIIDELEVIPSMLDFLNAALQSTDVELIIQAVQNKFRQGKRPDPINVIVHAEQAKDFYRVGEDLDQFIKLSVKEKLGTWW